MNQQQFQAEVMDELRQIEEAAQRFFSQADAFIAKQKQRQDETVTLCPYCMSEAGNKFMCCGEASSHFVTMSREAYENGEEL